MKIVVECGATKADWRAICQDGMIRSARTSGLNPSSMSTDMISEVVRKAVPALNPDGKRVGQIFFYGAGLVSEAVASPIRSVLEDWCPFAEVTFHSDLMAAARALFGDADGVVAIMGTGSNSCLYERGEIVRNISAGGYILGIPTAFIIISTFTEISMELITAMYSTIPSDSIGANTFLVKRDSKYSTGFNIV